jgi:hypothetical protein
MDAFANPIRGEAPLNIGGVDLVIAVEFGALARLSQAIRAESMEEIYRRLLGFEPFAVSCALLCLTVHPEGAAAALTLGAAASAKLSAADETAWRVAIEAALAGHIAAGQAARGEESETDRARRAVKRADAILAGDDPRKKAVNPSV